MKLRVDGERVIGNKVQKKRWENVGKNQVRRHALPYSQKLQLKITNMDYEIKKRLAFSYYMNPYSPTFMNALGSLTRAGYSYNYAKSYGSKVFFMERFIVALYGKNKKREREKRQEEQPQRVRTDDYE